MLLQYEDRTDRTLSFNIRALWKQAPLSCLFRWTNFLDMRKKYFLVYLLLLAFVVVEVFLLFSLISDRQLAATLAGITFVVVPLALMIVEYRRAQLSEWVWFLSILQFWIFFALPILALRIANWGVPFGELSILGIPGTSLHEWSSKSYMLIVIVTIIRRHMKD